MLKWHLCDFIEWRCLAWNTLNEFGQSSALTIHKYIYLINVSPPPPIFAQSVWNLHKEIPCLSLLQLSAFVCKLLPVPVYPQRCNNQTTHIAKGSSKGTGNGPYLRGEHKVKADNEENVCGFLYLVSTKPRYWKTVESYCKAWRAFLKMPKV